MKNNANTSGCIFWALACMATCSLALGTINKLGLASFSLWFILAPLWVPLALFFIIVVVLLVAMLVPMVKTKIERMRKR